MEIAKSIRSNSSLIILATATVAAFLISPANDIETRRKARNELKCLRKIIDLGNDYSEHARKELNRHPQSLLRMAIDTEIPMESVIKSAPPSESATSSISVCGGCEAAIAPAPVPAPAAVEPKPQNSSQLPQTQQVTNPDTRNSLDAPSISTAINGAAPAATPAPDTVQDIEITHYSKDGTAETKLRGALNLGEMHAKIDLQCFSDWGNALPFKSDVLRPTMSVADMYNFLANTNDNLRVNDDVQVFHPHAVMFARKFRALLASRPNATLKKWRLHMSPASPQPGASNPNVSACAKGSARLECDFEERGEITKACTTTVGDWRCAPCNSVQIGRFVDWIANSDNHRSTLAQLQENPSSPNCRWLPELHKIWSEVSTKEADEAIVNVDATIIAHTERISLFGLSASVASVSIAFPIAVSVAMIINVMLMSHLTSHIASNPQDTAAVKTHWFGFLPGKLSLCVTIFLVSIAPVFIAAMLVFVSPPHLINTASWIRAALPLLVLASAIWHSIELDKLRKQLDKTPQGGDTSGNHSPITTSKTAPSFLD